MKIRNIILLLISITFVVFVWLSGSIFQEKKKIPLQNNDLRREKQQYRTIVYGGPSSSHPYWFLLGKVVEKVSKEHKMNIIDITPPDEEDDALRNRLFSQATEKDIDGILIGNYIESKMKASVDKAYEKGIPVVVIGANDGHPGIKSSVGFDDYESGKIAGDYIVKETNALGTVLVLAGIEGYPGSDERRDGAVEKIRAAGMKVIIEQADWQVEKAYSFARDYLSKEKDITAIFGCWDPAIDAALHVVKEKGLLGEIVLVGYDGLEKTLHSIKAGEVNATIAPTDIEFSAKIAVELLSKHLNGEDIPSQYLTIGKLVTKENVNTFIKK